MSSPNEVERSHLVEVYRALDVAVVSLDRFGSWSAGQEPELAQATLRHLVDDIDLFPRLSNARRVLDSYFDHTPGDDHVDELERDLADEGGYWSAPT